MVRSSNGLTFGQNQTVVFELPTKKNVKKNANPGR